MIVMTNNITTHIYSVPHIKISISHTYFSTHGGITLLLSNKHASCLHITASCTITRNSTSETTEVATEK